MGEFADMDFERIEFDLCEGRPYKLAPDGANCHRCGKYFKWKRHAGQGALLTERNGKPHICHKPADLSEFPLVD